MFLQPADIVFTRGTGILSRLIRFFSTSRNEGQTQVNHVAIVVAGGTPQNAWIVEALAHVRRNPLWRYANPANQISVFRATNLTNVERDRIVTEAESYVGRTYGYLKLVAHLADYFLGGRYVFRRLTPLDRYPICSWVVAHAYSAAGKDFGVSDNAASPDDMWDFCLARPDKYDCIMLLGPLA